jgi:hypothetical protein
MSSSTASGSDPLAERGDLQNTDSLAEYDDYRNPEHLEAVFDEKGTIVHTGNHFDVSEATARRWLIEFEIYDPDTDGVKQPALLLEKLSPEDVGLTPLR